MKMVRKVGTEHIYALKSTNIHRAFDEGQVNHTLNEKEVLSTLRHPFIARLYTTFRDEDNVYFLLEYVGGGELFDVVKEKGKLDSDAARFYAANCVLAIEYLHSRGIAFRDIKSENLLLDARGYLKVVDFGMARFVRPTDRCNTFAGTLDYVSPEILSCTPYSLYVDWWALGCLVYEMLTGKTPFKGSEELRLQSMQAYSIHFDADVDPQAKSFVRQLLHPDLSKRLGGPSSLGEAAIRIRRHAWFKDIDWVALAKKEIKAPLIKEVSFALPPRLNIKIKKVRAEAEEEPPESPRTYSPKAINHFFDAF